MLITSHMYIYDMCKYTIHIYIYTAINIWVHTYARQSDREKDRKLIDFHLAHLAVLYMILWRLWFCRPCSWSGIKATAWLKLSQWMPKRAFRCLADSCPWEQFQLDKTKLYIIRVSTYRLFFGLRDQISMTSI